jgi:CheY-like chemotaxis protein
LLTEASHLSILEYIDHAPSGQEAVHMIANTFSRGDSHYGMIFMDLNMPVLNGFETTDKIRSFYKKKNFQQPMIIACTGHTEDEYIQKAWHHKMDEFIMKPTKIEVLKSIIQEMV